MLPWHEDERFWAMIEPQLSSEARRREAIDEASQAVRLLGLTAGDHILDHCCGVGRHSVELARLGFRVTGVDRTARYLERARAQAAAQGLAIEFVQEDVRCFRRPQSFDGAINLFTSFGYFENPEDDLRVLRNVADSLRPGGRLAIEIMGKEVLARIYTPKDWMEYSDGTVFLAERDMLSGWSLARNRWITIRPDGERVEFQFTHRVYSAAELESLATAAGLTPVATHGALDGRPYDRQATRLVMVAERPGGC